MTDIMLTDSETAALEALWRAGGEMKIVDIPKELRGAFVELYVKELVTENFGRTRKAPTIACFTPAGRALATELFTPPLTMPTDEGAVRAWLEARGLWAEGCKVRTDGNGDLLYVVTSPVVSVALYHATSDHFVVCIDRLAIVNDASEAQFRAEFDRACKIARALNANAGKGE